MRQYPITATRSVLIAGIVILTLAVALTLAGRASFNAGRATMAWLHEVDESRIFARPIWEVPQECLKRIVDRCLQPAEISEVPEMAPETPPAMAQACDDSLQEAEKIPEQVFAAVTEEAAEVNSRQEDSPADLADGDRVSSPANTYDDLSGLGVRELRDLARGKIRGFMRMKKARLVLELSQIMEA